MIKKITLMLCIIFFIGSTVKAATYYVQSGSSSAATWAPAFAISGTIVDLSTANGGAPTSFNAWFTDKSLVTPLFSGAALAAGDQVWIASGTYSLTGTVTLKEGVSIYGGFSGTAGEAVYSRAKNSTDHWDFTNPTVFDGSVAGVKTYLGFTCSAPITAATVVDGLTIQNCTNGTTASAGGAAKLSGTGLTMQNCIITACTATGTVTTAACAGVSLLSATLKDSYIHHNTSSSTGTTCGGAVTVYGNNGVVSGCKIENNTNTGGGGALYLYSSTSGVSISNCSFSNNSASGTGGAITSYITATNASPISITNCTFTANTAASSGGSVNLSSTVAGNIFNVSGCSFTSNTMTSTSGTNTSVAGGALYLSTCGFTIDKCTFTGNSTTNCGGGALHIQSASSCVISNSKFIGNTAGTASTTNGSAIFSKSNFTANNCLFADNTGVNVINFYGPTVASTFQHCTFANNVTSAAAAAPIVLTNLTPAYAFTNCLFYKLSGFSGQTSPTLTTCASDRILSTITKTTLTATDFKDAANTTVALRNYELSATSLALEAGTDLSLAASPVTTDINDLSRPQGPGVDIGAYEFKYLTVTVSTAAEFLAALSKSYNKTILLKPGTYQFNQTITITAGVTVRPETPGTNVFFSGTVGGTVFLIQVQGGSTLQGIYFKDITVLASAQPTTAIVAVDNSTLQECVFDGRSYDRIDPTGFTGEFVVASHGAKIYYNTFYDMKNGMLLYLDAWFIGKLSAADQSTTMSQIATYYTTPTNFYKSGVLDSRIPTLGFGGCHVKGNYFYNPYYYSQTGMAKTGNGKAAIKTGNGEICYGYHLIENNLFHDCSAEAEIIELKGKRQLVRYNTFYQCKGSLSLRHGSNTVVYSNYFLDGAIGIGVWGYNHQVLNNYFYKVPTPILTNSGKINSVVDGTMQITYVATASNLFANNTMVECGPLGINYALNAWNDGRVVGDSDLRYVNNFISPVVNNSIIKNTGGTTNQVRAAVSTFKSNLLTMSDTLASTVISTTDDVVFKTAQAIPMTPVTFGEYQLSFPTIPDAIHQKSAVISDKINTTYGYNNLYNAPWPNQDTLFLKDLNGYTRNAAYKGIGALVGIPTVADLSNPTSRLLRPSDLGSGFLGSSVKLETMPEVTTCYVSPTGTGSGNSWQDPCSLDKAMTVGKAGYNVYFKSGVYPITTQFTTADSVNYYGGFKGDEVTPADRRLVDLDGNGIVESWEFQNPTILNSTFSDSNAYYFKAFIIANTGSTFDGFTMTHVAAPISTSTLKSIDVSAVNVKFCNNTIKNSVVTTNGSNPQNVFFNSKGVVDNCLFEKNSLTFNGTATTFSSDAVYPFITLNGGTNSRFSNSIVRNNIVNANWGALSSNSNLRSMLMVLLPTVSGSIPTVKNCIIHNNELNYICSTPAIATTPVGGVIQAQYGGSSTAIVYDSIYNCTIANNRATNIVNAGLRFSQGSYTAHYAANNVCWNNKSVVNSVATVANIAQSATLTAPSLLTNNFSNGGGLVGSGTVVVNANNTLAATNSGSIAPLFKSPTTFVGAAWTTSDSTAIKQSVWSLTVGSCLAAKGVVVSGNRTDKAGVFFKSTPSVGAYESLFVVSTLANELKNECSPFSVEKGKIIIKKEGELIVLNMLGQLYWKGHAKVSQSISLAVGLYVVQLLTDEGDYSKKIEVSE